MTKKTLKENGMVQKIIDGKANNYEIREWLEFVDVDYLDKMLGLNPNLDKSILVLQRSRKIIKINNSI